MRQHAGRRKKDCCRLSPREEKIGSCNGFFASSMSYHYMNNLDWFILALEYKVVLGTVFVCVRT